MLAIFLVTVVRDIYFAYSSRDAFGELGDFPPRDSANLTVACRRASILSAFISEELYLAYMLSGGSTYATLNDPL